ncbi:hypothetical protein ACFYKT_18180 [Cytobacillus sp. FJAT-53684]|uniref:Uncharacterized protein n=1 Tax=Cytobacillus mangrovibacter TaxID=3299024 RepID=A0ABW6K266_9BACI
MLLYHPLHKTFDDFKEVFEYYFDNESGELIETDKELLPGHLIFIRDIADYAIIVTKVWEEDGKRYFSHDTAERLIVRARTPRGR